MTSTSPRTAAAEWQPSASSSWRNSCFTCADGRTSTTDAADGDPALHASPSERDIHMIVQPRIVAAAALVMAVACTSGSERASATDSVAARPNAETDSSAAPSTSPSPAAESIVTEHGLGPLRVGMTLAEAKTALGGALVVPVEGDTMGCDYANWRGGPRGVHVMIHEGRIARVEIDSAGIATAAGARVGDSEDRIRSLYPGRVTATPHKYEDGHYLTVNAIGDSSFAIVFEIAKARVTRYRAGRRPAVEYVEGCS